MKKVWALLGCMLWLLQAVASATLPEAEKYYASGLKNLESKEFLKAIGDFTMALSYQPDFGDAYLQRGKAKILLAEKMGFHNTELCFDLIEAMHLKKWEAIELLEKHCGSECYSPQRAFIETDIVFCADFSSKVLSKLPEGSSRLTNLVKFNLFNNRLTTMPEYLNQLTNLVYLDVSSNRLTDLGTGVGSLLYLTELNLSKNQLTILPAEIGNLVHLQKMFIRSNELKEIPSDISHCTSLEMLDLSLNHLTSLPASIKELKNLKTLILVGNPISGKQQKEIKALLPKTTIYFE